MNAGHARRTRRRTLGLVAMGAMVGAVGVASTGAAAAPPTRGADKGPMCRTNDSVRIVQNNCTVLSIDKTGNPTVLPGGTVNYELTVRNVGFGPVPYEAIWVKDMSPKVKVTPPVDPPPSLAPGDSLVWTASQEVSPDLWRCGKWVRNTAIVKLGYPKQPTARSRAAQRSSQQWMGMFQGSDTWSTRVVCPLDVAIAKSSTQTGIEPGGTVNYVIRVTNPGPIPLPTSFLEVTDPTAGTLTPPAEMPDVLTQGEYLDWAATKSVTADVALCGTNVENSASVTVTVPEKTTPAEDSVRRANGRPTRMPNYTSWPKDPVTTSAAGIPISGGICPVVTPSGTVTPAAAPVALRPAGPALSVTKTGPTRVLAGGRVGYRITVTNTGSADATNVTLRDQAPGVFTVSSRPSGSTVSGRTIDWNIGTLTPGQSVTKAVRFAARRTATGRACNVALATATGVDQVRDRACTTIVAARRPATPVTG